MIIVFLVLILFIYACIKCYKDNSSQSSNNAYNDSYSESTHIEQTDNDTIIKTTVKHTAKSKDSYSDVYNEDDIYDKIFDMLLSYEYLTDEIFDQFEEDFNIDHRIKLLKKAIEKLDAIKEYAYSHGAEGIKVFEEESSPYFEHWDKLDILKNISGDHYHFEFENMKFSNYNFLSYLLKEYTSTKVSYTQHLKQEKYYYEVYSCGGQKEYDEMIEYEKHHKALKKQTISLIQENEDILQSQLIKMFEEEDKNQVRKIIKQLEESGKLTKEKQGSSYKLKYLK